MYISHRLSPLKLAPDIQLQVDAGGARLKDGWQIASETEDHAQQGSLVEDVK